MLVLKVGLWGTLAASISGKACEQQVCEEPPGKQTLLNPSPVLRAELLLLQRGHAGFGSPVPSSRHSRGGYQGSFHNWIRPNKELQSEGVPCPSPPAIAAAY